MGNLCDCFSSKQDAPTPKTPLLGSGAPPAVTAPHKQGLTAPTTTQPGHNAPSVAGRSARLHKPLTSAQEEMLSSLEEISSVEMKTITTVPSLDKTFQDHGKLYNDLYSSFQDLRKQLHYFKAFFEKETAGIPILSDCLKLLAQRCGGAKLSGSRTKNCIQIDCDRKEVSEKCTGAPEDVLDIIETYNKTNRLIRSLLEKGPQVRSSIRLVLEQESALKLEVVKADPDGRCGPEPVRAAAENFTCLHRLPAYIDTIYKYSNKTFKEIVSGSKVLFEES